MTEQPETLHFRTSAESDFWRDCVLAVAGNPDIRHMVGAHRAITDLADEAVLAFRERSRVVERPPTLAREGAR
jgi:hypothetical protein